ncbi:MAG: hypothetical protein AB9869_14020 [Verrucomicrobiia bacterium]
MLAGEENFVWRGRETALFSVGTPVYRGLSYRAGLGAALDDFTGGCLRLDEFRGNFCLLFWAGGHLKILTDTLDLCHVFMDRERTRLSTSFLALLASFSAKQPLNRLAVLEKLTTGYIVGPETLIDGIQQFVPDMRRELRSDGLSAILPLPKQLHLNASPDPFSAAVEDHLGRLKEYFQDIAQLSREYGLDLGLSSGYDSRLLALLAKRIGADFSVHTHWTQGVHDSEKRRVEALVKALNVPLRVVPTVPLEQMPTEQLEEALLDGLYYYDARSADNSGAYSPTYTRQYKAATLGTHRLRLNGEGGEIYRNYYHTSRPRLSFVAWMRHKLYFGPASAALRGTRLEREMTANIVAKLSARLGLDLSGTVDLAVTRAYYGEVRVPDCEGVLANADMQLAHFLMPFAEASLQRSAYGLVPHIGLSGGFQARLIERLDSRVASIPSHHGFSLIKEPFKHQAKAAVRGYVPDHFWLARRAMRFARPQFGARCAAGYNHVRNRSQLVQEGEEAVRSFVPGFDPRMAAREHPSKAAVVFLGVFLREFSAYIKGS